MHLEVNKVEEQGAVPFSRRPFMSDDFSHPQKGSCHSCGCSSQSSIVWLAKCLHHGG